MSRYNELREIIYRFIKRYIDENGFPPSRREICTGLDISSTSVVAHHLTKLDQYGRIRLIPDVARGIVIVEEAFPSAKKEIQIFTEGRWFTGLYVPEDRIVEFSTGDFIQFSKVEKWRELPEDTAVSQEKGE